MMPWYRRRAVKGPRAAPVLVLVAELGAGIGLADLAHHFGGLVANHYAYAGAGPHQQEARGVDTAGHAMVAGTARATDDREKGGMSAASRLCGARGIGTALNGGWNAGRSGTSSGGFVS